MREIHRIFRLFSMSFRPEDHRKTFPLKSNAARELEIQLILRFRVTIH